MKIESKKLIGVLLIAVAFLGGASSAMAQSVHIVPNPNNQYFLNSSAYAANYYANTWYSYNNNQNSPCYGFRACYPLNGLTYSYNYPTYYSYPTNYSNNYNYGYNTYRYNSNYVAYTFEPNVNNSVYAANNYEYGNYNYYPNYNYSSNYYQY